MIKYRGSGEHVPGIPARDLTDEDLAGMSDRRRRDVATARFTNADGDSVPLYQAAEASPRPKRRGGK